MDDGRGGAPTCCFPRVEERLDDGGRGPYGRSRLTCPSPPPLLLLSSPLLADRRPGLGQEPAHRAGDHLPAVGEQEARQAHRGDLRERGAGGGGAARPGHESGRRSLAYAHRLLLPRHRLSCSAPRGPSSSSSTPSRRATSSGATSRRRGCRPSCCTAARRRRVCRGGEGQGAPRCRCLGPASLPSPSLYSLFSSLLNIPPPHRRRSARRRSRTSRTACTTSSSRRTWRRAASTSRTSRRSSTTTCRPRSTDVRGECTKKESR